MDMLTLGNRVEVTKYDDGDLEIEENEHGNLILFCKDGAIELRDMLNTLYPKEHLTKEEWHRRVALLYDEVWGSCSAGGIDSFNPEWLDGFREAGDSPDVVVRERLK